MNLPSKRVFVQSAKLAAVTTVFTMFISVGIRAFLGVTADGVTVAIRLVMPFVTAYPIALAYFSKLENLENSYKDLLRRANDLARQAMVDPLTGLLNRRAFVSQFELASEHRVSGVFCIADVDYLKDVNDRYGHSVGDQVLLAVAQTLAEVLPGESLIARIGGDEFCAFIPNAEFDAAVRWQAELDRHVGGRFAQLSGLECEIASLSLGAVATRDGADFSSVLKLADAQLYRNKRRRAL